MTVGSNLAGPGIESKEENGGVEEALEMTDLMKERYELTLERIREVENESLRDSALTDYFQTAARFLLQVEALRVFSEEELRKGRSFREMVRRYGVLFRDLLPGAYEESYVNPVYASARLGDGFGKILSFLFYEMKSLAYFAYENKWQDMLIRMELFLQIHAAFSCEEKETGGLPAYETVREIIYWFVMDYAETAAEKHIADLVKCADQGSVMEIFYELGLEDTAEELGRKLQVAGVRAMPVLVNFSILNAKWLWEDNWDEEEGLSQCVYDHREDMALFLDKGYVNRQLEVLRSVLERNKGNIGDVEGVVVLRRRLEEGRIIGERNVLHLGEGQRQLREKYCSKIRALQKTYLKEGKVWRVWAEKTDQGWNRIDWEIPRGAF